MNNILEIKIDNACVKGFLLCEALKLFCNDLKLNISSGLSAEFVIQIDKLFFPFQKIAGSADNFSFVVYSLPRIEFEQRRLLSYHEYADIQLDFSHGAVHLTIDGFKKIDGIRIIGKPEIYNEILNFIAS